MKRQKFREGSKVDKHETETFSMFIASIELLGTLEG